MDLIFPLIVTDFDRFVTVFLSVRMRHLRTTHSTLEDAILMNYNTPVKLVLLKNQLL